MSDAQPPEKKPWPDEPNPLRCIATAGRDAELEALDVPDCLDDVEELDQYPQCPPPRPLELEPLRQGTCSP